MEAMRLANNVTLAEMNRATLLAVETEKIKAAKEQAEAQAKATKELEEDRAKTATANVGNTNATAVQVAKINRPAVAIGAVLGALAGALATWIARPLPVLPTSPDPAPLVSLAPLAPAVSVSPAAGAPVPRTSAAVTSTPK